MPIGFWAISRSEVIDLIDFQAEKRWGKALEHTPNYHHLIDKICRDLPHELSNLVDDYLERSIITARADRKILRRGGNPHDFVK